MRLLTPPTPQSGDIICFQVATIAPAVAEAGVVAEVGASTPDHEPLLQIPQFFEHVKNRVVVHLHKLPPPQNSHGPGVREKERAVEISMDKRWSYDQVQYYYNRIYSIIILPIYSIIIK